MTPTEKLKWLINKKGYKLAAVQPARTDQVLLQRRATTYTRVKVGSKYHEVFKHYVHLTTRGTANDTRVAIDYHGHILESLWIKW